MIDANPGDMLDDAHPLVLRWSVNDPQSIEKDFIHYPAPVYQTLVVDPCFVPSDGERSYSFAKGIHCPICGGAVDRGYRAYCQTHNLYCLCGYCPDCWLLYESIHVGTLYEDGEYIEW